jgi:hypothetical protein
VLSRANLDKQQSVVISCYQVNLSQPAAILARQNGHSVVPEQSFAARLKVVSIQHCLPSLASRGSATERKV